MSEEFYRDSDQYDAMYADLVVDVPLLAGMARDAGGPVLEVCCGNGRVLVPAREAGADIDGLDLSAPMLEGLRRKLSARGLSAGVFAGDMRTFELPRRYALVLVPFNSFMHNLTQADQLATLRRCRAHLAPGGRLAMVLFNPAPDRLLWFAERERLTKEGPDPSGTGRVRCFDRTEDEWVEQVRRVTRRVEFVDDAGRARRTEAHRFTLRYVYKPEMELLLAAAGFARWEGLPLAPDPASGALAVADRAPQPHDTLLWMAWRDPA